MKKGKTMLVLAGLATAAMHIMNRIEYTRSTFKNTLSCSSNKYYEWRFGKIRYHKKGAGYPILLLHDLTIGSSSYEYCRIEDELSKKYEVYSIDFLGYGLSDKTDITYTNYLYVQMITDFIKTIIGRRTNVIASGDASPIAFMVCHNDHDLVNKLIVINPQSLYQLNQIPSKQTRLLKFFMETPILGTFIYNLHSSKAAFYKLFQEKFFFNPNNIEEKDILTYIEAAHTPDHNSKHAYASYIGRYMNANIIHALKEINNSIYMIAGSDKEDNQTIVENYVYYNNAIESVFIPKTKQLPHMEKPDEVLNYLSVYLS